jgi:hypothetical protein
MHITELERQLAEDQSGLCLAELCAELHRIESEILQQLCQQGMTSEEYNALERQAEACRAAESVVLALARRYHPSLE